MIAKDHSDRLITPEGARSGSRSPGTVTRLGG